MSNKEYNRSPNIWISVLLIAIGVMFLLQNFDILYIANIWDFWPLILVVIGISKLFHSDFKDLYSSGILIGLGILFLLIEFDVFDFADIFQFWPVILIIIGVRIILAHKQQTQGGLETDTDIEAYHTENRVDAVAIFGGREMHFSTENFRGGSVTALFGGTDLHFDNSRIALGKHKLDVFVMFGGVNICAPPNWNIVLKGVPIFGGFSDSRKKLAPPEEISEERVLIISGFAMFGGVEIKDA